MANLTIFMATYAPQGIPPVYRSVQLGSFNREGKRTSQQGIDALLSPEQIH